MYLQIKHLRKMLTIGFIQKAFKHCKKKAKLLHLKDVFPWDIPFVEPFRRYLYDNPNAINELKSSMDEESCKCIDLGLKRLFSYPGKEYLESYKYYPAEIQTPQERANWVEHKSKIGEYKQKYSSPYAPFSPTEFFYQHGLIYVGNMVKEYLKAGVFFDCGAFDGASSVVMSTFSPSKIIAVEPSGDNNKKAKKTWERISKDVSLNLDMIEIAECCVGDFDGEVLVSEGDHFAISKDATLSVPIKKIDSFCEAQNIDNVKWIKADLEGASFTMIKGAELVIKKSRPLLTIGCYHNPDEFFGIKKLVESWDLNYHFMMRRCQCVPESPYNEITLIAYPKELHENI